MKDIIVYTTTLKKYKPLICNGPVFSQYNKLKNYLRKNLDEDSASLFAEPYIIPGDKEGSWRSDKVSSKAIVFTNLTDAEKEHATVILRQKLQKLQEHAQKMLESPLQENKNWGELINNAVIIPDTSHVLVEGDKIVLVVWGFQYADEKQTGDFKKEFLVQSKRPMLPVVKKTEEPIVEEPVDTGNNELAAQMDNNSNIQPEEEEKIIEPEISNPVSLPPLPPPPSIVKKTWLQRWLWLLLLVLLLLLFFLLRKCNDDKGGSRYLPDQPGRVVPVDSTKITVDPDTIRTIVGDRLNVALRGKNKDLEAFAKKFKEVYPGNEYSIIYYDTITYRLQLEIPAAEREKIKAEIKGKMPEFELLVWYEGIFRNNHIPSDPGFNEMEKSWYHKEVKAPEAWDVTEGDSSLIVAIVDDGFDLTHPELASKVVSPWNVPAYSSNVSSNNGRQFHGSHVAGIALGIADNGKGSSGIAPKCRFLPIQVGDHRGTMTATAIIDGVLYAIDHGASVINMSLGAEMPRSITSLPPARQQEIIQRLYKDEEEFWTDLFKSAAEKNVVVVLAAGNQNILTGLDAMQRSPYTINVSAVDPSEQKASFSNYGSNSTISAPGVHIFSSVPNNRFEYLDGTSMAAPIVTGGVALIKSVNPALTFNEIVNLIQSTGLPVNSNQYIGNIIQLDKAVGVAQKNHDQLPKVDCPEVQQKIDSLLREIEKLRQTCADSSTGDTLRIPPDSKNLDFTTGKWKSTSYLFSMADGQKVTIYFEFFGNGTGKITLVQADNTACSAGLTLTLDSGELHIRQNGDAKCVPPPRSYNPYRFKCKTDPVTGRAECEAQNARDSNNRFTFKLVKIK